MIEVPAPKEGIDWPGRARHATSRAIARCPDFGEASRLDPGDANNHVDAAEALVRLRRYPEAEVEAREALAQSPSGVKTRFCLGAVLGVPRKWPEAIPLLESVLRTTPNNKQVISNLGWALTNAGRLPEGIALLEKAVGLDPRDAFARENLARARLLAGDRAGAARENEHLRPLDTAAAAEIDALLAGGAQRTGR